MKKATANKEVYLFVIICLQSFLDVALFFGAEAVVLEDFSIGCLL